MIKYECDHCKRPIKEVAYVITPTTTEGTPLNNGYHLHYDCIIPWRESDR
jgi:hypothetical protein